MTHMEFMSVCTLRQKTKYSPSCGSEMSPGSSPGGTLGQSLNQPICCLSNPWPCAGGRDESGEEATAALGQMQGVLLGNKCPFIRPPFLHGLGECCRDKAGHALGGISEPFSNYCGLLSPPPRSSAPASPQPSSLPARAVKTYPGLREGQLWLYAVPWAPGPVATPGARPWHTHSQGTAVLVLPGTRL